MLSVNEWFFFKWYLHWHHLDPFSYLQKAVWLEHDKQDIICSVADLPAFKRDDFLVYSVIHLSHITKLYSLSSLWCPIGQSNLQTGSQTEIKAKIKTGELYCLFTWHISEDRIRAMAECLYHNVYNDTVLHTTKHCHRSSLFLLRCWIAPTLHVSQIYWETI